MLLEQDGVLYLRLKDVKSWLYKNGPKIQLSTLSKVLVELGVKVEGIKVISYYDKYDSKNKKVLTWGFIPDSVRKC